MKRNQIYKIYKKFCKTNNLEQTLKWPRCKTKDLQKKLSEFRKKRVKKGGGMKYEKVHSKYNKKFKMNEDIYDVNFDVRAHKPEKIFKELEQDIDKLLKKYIKKNDVKDTDWIRITVDSEEMNTESSTTYHRTKKIGDLLYEFMSRARHVSNSDGEVYKGNLVLKIHHIHTPKGGSRGFTDLRKVSNKRKKQGIIVIQNPNDQLCLFRAVACGLAKKNKKIWKQIIDPRKTLQFKEAKKLAESIGHTDIQKKSSLIEIHDLAKQINHNIIVHTIQLGYSCEYKTNIENSDGEIYLLKDKEHFDLVIKPNVIFGSKFYCDICNQGFNNKKYHKCLQNCRLCRGDCGNENNPHHCCCCNITYKNEVCFKNHESTCLKKWNCPKCKCCYFERREKSKLNRLVETYGTCEMKNFMSESIRDFHKCGYNFCEKCGKYDDLKNHDCYINFQTPKKHCENFIFYDFESKIDKTTGLHTPIYANAQYQDGTSFEFHNDGEDCSREFFSWLLQKKHTDFTCVAHNFKAYDSYFLLKHLLETNIKPKVIFAGSKTMYLEIHRGFGKRMRFIDSYNFLPTALSKLPSMFGLEGSKGYFPYTFFQGMFYKGPMPEKYHYNYEKLDLKDRAKFDNWYNKQKNFDYFAELKKYCYLDVKILREACMKFREIMLDITKTDREFEDENGNKYFKTVSVDPFSYVTIASTAFAVQRGCFQKNDQILNPQLSKNAFSKKATTYLDFYAWKNKIEVQHALNGSEKYIRVPDKTGKIRKFTVDGFIKETNTIIEFLGSYWHGDPRCYNYNYLNKRNNIKMGVLHKRTMDRLALLKNNGFKVIQMWEKDYDEKILKTKEFKEFLATYERKIFRDMNPRDAFCGGRTETFQTYREAKKGEKIRYVDFTSLYPYVNANCEYPVGKPKIITNNCMEFFKTRKVFGIVGCQVLPPNDLKVPILPFKSGKLTFSLCSHCSKNNSQTFCSCSIKERTMTGAWTSLELYKAVELGYKILSINEIHHFENTTTGIFRPYIKTFLKLKQEASGFPPGCKNKQKYIDDYYKKEGIKLDFEKIAYNPGLRTVAKLLLNSLWGKYGQKEYYDQNKIVRNNDDLWKLFDAHQKTVIVKQVIELNDETLEVLYEEIKSQNEKSNLANVYVAAITTSHARLKLYNECLSKIKFENLLYCDTDSCIFVENSEQKKLPLGPYLGELTDELDEGFWIEEFVSTGPKSYGYRATNGKEAKTVMKVKGFTLNYDTREKINIQSLLKLIEKPENKIEMPTFNITRNKKTKALSSVYSNKFLSFVFDKRVLNHHTTLPFGYSIGK